MRIAGVAAAAVFVFCGVLACADPLIGRAAERRKAGDAEGAATLYRAWLAIYPGAPGAPQVFGSYFTVEQDFPQLVSESRRFLVAARGLACAGAQFLRIARLFDIAGRVEEAREAYLAAAEEGAGDAALLPAFLLSLEMNDEAAMKGTLGHLGGSGSTGLFLGALASLQSGDDAAARSILLGLASQTGDPQLALRALLVLYATSAARGDTAQQASARGGLKRRFPNAPETALAADSASRVVLAPGPDALGGGLAANGAPPAIRATDSQPAGTTATPTASTQGTEPPGTAVGPPPKGTYSVQAGAFRMRENADDLITELTKRGFAALVVQETVQGKERYRVLAGAGLTADQARDVVTKLSRAGFSGFLVADK